MIAQRLVAMYTTDQTSTLEVILGASSLDDMINRIDNAKSIASLDANVLSQVKTFRRSVDEHGAALAKARSTQQRVVAERAAAKEAIASHLAQQNSLLSSLKGQIAQLVQAQQAEQQRLQQQAEARLAAQRQVAQSESANTVVGVSAATPEADTVVAPPPTYGGVVAYALSQLGTPYVWGGAAPGGFDCSGLVMWAYAQVGVSLPHSTYAQYTMGVPVSKDELAPGDLVFFDGVGHVGLYIGNGQFVEAPHTGAYVQISNLNEGWYAETYVGARRIL